MSRLLEVSTDKVDTEIPSPAAGVLTKIVAQEDDTVEIGGELAVIGDAAEGAKTAPSNRPNSLPRKQHQNHNRSRKPSQRRNRSRRPSRSRPRRRQPVNKARPVTLSRC